MREAFSTPIFRRASFGACGLAVLLVTVLGCGHLFVCSTVSGRQDRLKASFRMADDASYRLTVDVSDQDFAVELERTVPGALERLGLLDVAISDAVEGPMGSTEIDGEPVPIGKQLRVSGTFAAGTTLWVFGFQSGNMPVRTWHADVLAGVADRVAARPEATHP